MRLRTFDLDYRLSKWVEAGASGNLAAMGGVIRALANQKHLDSISRAQAVQDVIASDAVYELGFLAWITANVPAMKALHAAGLHATQSYPADDYSLAMQIGAEFDLQGYPWIVACLRQGQGEVIPQALKWYDPCIPVAGLEGDLEGESHEAPLAASPAPWLAWALGAGQWKVAETLWNDARVPADKAGLDRALLDLSVALVGRKFFDETKDHYRDAEMWVSRLLDAGADPSFAVTPGTCAPAEAARQMSYPILKTPPNYPLTKPWEAHRRMLGLLAAKPGSPEQEHALWSSALSAVERFAKGYVWHDADRSIEPCVPGMRARLAALPVDLMVSGADDMWQSMWAAYQTFAVGVERSSGVLEEKLVNPVHVEFATQVIRETFHGREHEVPAEAFIRTVQMFARSETSPAPSSEPLLSHFFASQAPDFQEAYLRWERSHMELQDKIADLRTSMEKNRDGVVVAQFQATRAEWTMSLALLPTLCATPSLPRLRM